MRRVSELKVIVGVAALLFSTGAAYATPSLIVGEAVDGVVGVSISTDGLDIAGTENQLVFTTIRVTAKANGRPDCSVNPDIEKGGTAFSFLPANCEGTACTAVKAIVLALDNVDPIPDGSELYTCKVEGEGQFDCQAPGGSDPAGAPIEMTCGYAQAPGDTPTPTETPTEVEPEVTPTNTSPPAPPTATNTSAPPPTNTRPPSVGKVDDDGCQVVSPAQASAAWLLLIPAAALLWFRRRSR